MEKKDITSFYCLTKDNENKFSVFVFQKRKDSLNINNAGFGLQTNTDIFPLISVIYHFKIMMNQDNSLLSLKI